MRCSDKAVYQRVCARKHGIRPNTVGKRGFALGDVAGCTTPRGRPCLNPQRTQGRNAPVPAGGAKPDRGLGSITPPTERDPQPPRRQLTAKDVTDPRVKRIQLAQTFVSMTVWN
nr:hypothetical protein GCM10017611_12950 [Rhodococcus wratislaviensis]